MTTSNRPWKDFMDEIYNIYNYENFEEIYLLSDSRTWILSGANELKLFSTNKVILNTCEFHVKHTLIDLLEIKTKETNYAKSFMKIGIKKDS